MRPQLLIIASLLAGCAAVKTSEPSAATTRADGGVPTLVTLRKEAAALNEWV